MKKKNLFSFVRPTARAFADRVLRSDAKRSANSAEADDDYYSPTDWERDPTESDTDYEERTQDLTDWLEGSLDIVNRKSRRPDPRLVAGAIKRLNVGKAARVVCVASFIGKNAKLLRFCPMIFRL